jgi:hypothetical protein
MRQRWSWLALLISGLGCAACGHFPEDEPLTPEDKARLIEEMMASSSLRKEAGMPDGPSAWCIDQTKLAQMTARQQRYRGAEGFNSRGCGTGQ